MAHNIEFREGKYSMAWAGGEQDTPWHGLGKRVPNDLTPEQMLKAAGLDWTVETHEAFVEINGQKIPVDRHALVRSVDNKVLDTVGDGWKPVQNHEAFEFFNEFVMNGDMEMNTAGSLRDGQIVWALAKVKESFELFGGDVVESYLLFTNPHRYGQSIDVRFTPIRVVCNNTLTLSLNLRSDQMVKLSHRSNFDSDKVKEMLGIASTKLSKYKEMAEFLGSKKYTDDNVTDYFKAIFPSNNSVDLSRNALDAIEIVDQQPGHEFAEGSWWSLFNTVTFMTDHVIGRGNDTRLYSSWYGPNRTTKIKALETAVEMANAA